MKLITRKLICICLFYFTFTISAHSNDEILNHMYSWIDKLLIRKNPSLTSKAINFLNKGEKIAILKFSQGNLTKVILKNICLYSKWVYAKKIDGTYGYIYRGGLEFTKGFFEKYVLERPESKWAIVAPDSIKEYLDSSLKTLGDISCKFRTFSAEAQALAWLKE